jgi:glycosyltransferase involved in cell wall biosynthesis
MTSEGFPRLLVVTSNNFNSTTGGGITLTNLFRGWPPECIANVHEDPTPEDTTVCRKSYRLSDREIRWSWPFSPFQPKGHATEGLGGAPDNGVSPQSLSKALLGDGVPRTVNLSDSLRTWIDAFRPQLIYSFLGSMAQIRLTRSLVDHTEAHLAIHVMDDWPEVIYRRGLFGSFLRRTVLKEFEQLLRGSSLRLGICDEMCAEYQRRYGYSFFPFHNALDMHVWEAAARRDWSAGNPFVVCYAGSILAEGQKESLRDVCHAVERLAAGGTRIRMNIHAPEQQSALLRRENLTNVEFNPPPPPDRIASILSGADLLVLPFNFDRESARYLRFSMPTKVPAYMASGSPVLMYAPSGIAPVNYARNAGWGFVLTEQGVSALVTAIGQLMSDQTLRETLGRRAQAIAHDRHDAADVRRRFQTALAEAARR